jgi:hypothetical protein
VGGREGRGLTLVVLAFLAAGLDFLAAGFFLGAGKGGDVGMYKVRRRKGGREGGREGRIEGDVRTGLLRSGLALLGSGDLGLGGY